MFEQFNYSTEQIRKYFQTAVNDLRLAKSTNEPELVFYACYSLLIKTAMAVCAKNSLRVKSRAEHHMELINKLAEYIPDLEIEVVADKMRVKRNRNLYNGGTVNSIKEADFYLSFCKELIRKTESYLFPNKLL